MDFGGLPRFLGGILCSDGRLRERYFFYYVFFVNAHMLHMTSDLTDSDLRCTMASGMIRLLFLDDECYFRSGQN
jgi:hypothetical protein